MHTICKLYHGRAFEKRNPDVRKVLVTVLPVLLYVLAKKDPNFPMMYFRLLRAPAHKFNLMA